jgi:hypothetical protein
LELLIVIVFMPRRRFSSSADADMPCLMEATARMAIALLNSMLYFNDEPDAAVGSMTGNNYEMYQ